MKSLSAPLSMLAPDVMFRYYLAHFYDVHMA